MDDSESSQYLVDDYKHVHLKMNKMNSQVGVHRLVALHFLPNPHQHPLVNHKDGVKSNNHVLNLEWASHEQNCQHALEMGLKSGFMSIPEKREFLVRVLAGEAIRDIALQIGRREETLSKMLRVMAEKDGLVDAWKAEMKRRRTLVAIRNLEAFDFRHPKRIKNKID